MKLDTPKRRVRDYYDQTFFDYFTVLFRHKNYSMNYGYWDESVHNRSEATHRLLEKISELLNLHPYSTLLDAGSGLGEATCWFASKVGCQCIGVTLSQMQIKEATKIARDRDLLDKIKYLEMDYTKTTFNDNSFDAIIAIETICHVADKQDFYREAYRLLKPGGKLVVGEFTYYRLPKTKLEKIQTKKFIDGWEMPNLLSTTEHKKIMKLTGFKQIVSEDYSSKTRRVARYFYLCSLPGLPIYWLLHKFGIMNKYQLGNAYACKYQWITRQSGIWGHTLFSATK